MTSLAHRYETVIGLEVHVQLKTATKLFCRCENRFGGGPNTRVCPVCAGLPGALPVLNRKAVTLGVRAALALGARVVQVLRFDRKNYFYPDLPKGYQITQHIEPLAEGGALHIEDADGLDRSIRLARIHLEEDAGKSLHRPGEATRVDLNRSGVPLLEIVTEPDLRTPLEAYRYLTLLKLTLQHLDVSDCHMEEGSLRCDVNVSVRPRGTHTLGTRVEIKNLNSFKAVQKALDFEHRRQAEIHEAGAGPVQRETRLFEARTRTTRTLRLKEETHDYRFFPEPDLPPIPLDARKVAAIRETLPELPGDRVKRLRTGYGIPAQDAWVLVENPRVADYFEAVAGATGDGKAAANWVMTEVKRILNEGADIESFPVTREDLAGLILLQNQGALTVVQARSTFGGMVETGRSAATVAAEQGLRQVSDPARLERLVQEAVATNPGAVSAIQKGKNRARDALVGHVMRATRGQADPKRVQELLDRILKDADRHPGRKG